MKILPRFAPIWVIKNCANEGIILKNHPRFSMLTCKLSNTHADFCALTHALDAELSVRYGKAQAVYDQHNVIDPIETTLVGYEDGLPVACGCFKKIDAKTVEIKRMFVSPNCRRRGFSSQLLRELEAWAVELGFSEARLETGKGQPEAIALYAKMGYAVILNYGSYVGMENSVCMHKALRS
ncbi:GNAT family N-acetyltransferase [Sulfurospirillum sp. SCADC]|uniref:GNAT family N-acetyltransferase n=2 Tax=Sulfurospirillum TaxID=57665 RepID=UPI0025EBE079|nr:GNAT family N-acetyltransferase [Sulfurospirillum sp. SCADC]